MLYKKSESFYQKSARLPFLTILIKLLKNNNIFVLAQKWRMFEKTLSPGTQNMGPIRANIHDENFDFEVIRNFLDPFLDFEGWNLTTKLALQTLECPDKTSDIWIRSSLILSFA